MKEQLSTWRWAVGGILLSSALGLGFWGLSTTDVRADRGEHERGEEREDDERRGARNRVAQDPTYTEECGSCHLAYPPNMLPRKSWQAIMSGLEDHFDENAELDTDTQKQIEGYLAHHAADNGEYQSRRYLGRQGAPIPPLRITELRFFIREHDEIPARLVTANNKVGSFSQCDACHQNANQGDFDEDSVTIPGYGRWDD